MAKRPRRRAVILESEDDEDDDDNGAKQENAKASSDIRLARTQSGKTFEVRSERKRRKSAEQVTKNSLTEPKKKASRKKPSHGTLPLDIITVPTRNTGASSKRQKGVGATEFGDDENRFLKQSENYRLWVDKYAPKNVGELIVHGRKVAEVKEWLEGQLLKPYGSHQGSRLLVLTGPAGVGKTAVIHVLADLLKLELLEWRTPAPESWQEYSHHAASGGPYVSKLDEFESFLERGRKMCTLPVVSVTSASKIDDVKQRGAKVLFIDDLPVVSSRDHLRRLVRSLGHLAVSREFPAIVVVTDETADGGRLRDSDNTLKDVTEILEREGAKEIAFNPVTVNAMKKLLRKVQVLENCRLSSESLYNVAETSAGDIRQALTSLQFLCLGCQSNNLHHLMWDPGGLPNSQSDTNSQAATDRSSQSVASIAGGRDYSLALFHALGKLLHNKRHIDEPVHAGNGTVPQVKEELQRHPLNMEEPEVILLQAHSETATILGFLHENVMQFIDEDAIDDVAAVSAYFSDTDYLLGAQGGFKWRRTVVDANEIDPSQVTSAAANSVVARGVLFGNSHPAPRRWQSLRAPSLWQVERQFRQNKVQRSTRSAHGVLDATEIFNFLLQPKDYSTVSQSPYRHFPHPSRSHAGMTTSMIDSGEVEDPMELENSGVEDDGYYLPLVQQHKPPTTQENFEFEGAFMQMCVKDVEDVEDDIEDADD